MSITDITIPQLGEGLQEVLIREFLKQPGQTVKRDEPIYVMETDKALVDAESPVDGVLQEWLVRLNEVVAVGKPAARILTDGDSGVPAAGPKPVPAAVPPDERNGAVQAGHAPPGAVLIPPRTRAYCRQVGIGEQEMKQIPAPRGKLMPADVELYHSRKTQRTGVEPGPDNPTPGGDYVERPLPPQQAALQFRLKRSSQLVIPGNIARAVEWQRITDIVGQMAQRNVRASEFQVLAYCVAQASKSHPKFRSTLADLATVREYSHLNLGLAIARPDDELITAVVAQADELGLADFLNRVGRQMRQAWKEGDQAGSATQMVLSYLGSYGVTEGVPTLVAPASAVMFIGASYKFQDTLQAKVSVTFDHRLINGVAAARFINTLDREIDHLHGQTTQFAKENVLCLQKK